MPAWQAKLFIGVGYPVLPRYDPKQINTVVEAYRAQKFLEAGQTIPEMGVKLRVSKIQVAGFVRMFYFVPQIAIAILEGQQPLGLVTSMLMRPG